MSQYMDLLVLGDQAVDVYPFLKDVLARGKFNTIFTSFLTRASAALREEVSQLPCLEKESIPSFSTIQELADRYHNRHTVHPAIESALLTISQFAHYIGYTEEDVSNGSDVSRTYVVGLCTGSLAAAAIASSPSPATLTPLAVEVVRIAFRTGIHVGTVAQRIQQTADSPQCWAVLLSGITELESQQSIEDFHKERGIPAPRHAYISAVSTTAITISGPPSTLEQIFSASKSFEKIKRVKIPIYGPYHASHLHHNATVQKILGSEDSPGSQVVNLFHPQLPLLSTQSGTWFSAKSTRELLELVLTETLIKPLRFDHVLNGCVSLARDFAGSECRVRPVGPTNAVHSVVSALTSGTSANIKLRSSLSWLSEKHERGFQGSGSMKNSKLAIVGMAGRFPGAADHEKFWTLLEQGLDVHRKVPKERFDPETHFDPTGKKRNTTHTPFGCFIDDPGLFDPRFFNMSPREALQTDPMQRLALVTAYEALEMSGYVPNRTPSTKLDRVGTFYGQTSDDWREINAAQDVDTYFITGGVRAFGPGRINYHFKFSGPSFSVDTACSSGMAAVQLACTSLWAGDCDTAIAGGVSVMTNSDIFSGLSRGQFLSKVGPCQTFDNEADGYCRADGIGSVIIKRLEDAEADKDNILGVILGSATNHSAEAISITHPHGETQEYLYRKILDEANVDPLAVDYVEMHGTGTQAGDGTEMLSVTNVFAPTARLRDASQALHLGAVKANIGHGEAASGVTALIKCLLMMQKNAIPPHVGIKNKINQGFPKDLTQRNVHIAMKNKPWKAKNGKKRVVFVNNFSAAGGNTGLLMEDGPPQAHEKLDPRSTQVISVSAKGKSSLKRNMERLIAYIDDHPTASISDLSYTLTARRMQHNYRVSFAATTVAQVRAELSSRLDNTIDPVSNTPPKVAFVFTGQGSHYASLAKEFFETSSQFNSDIFELDAISRGMGFPSFLPLINGETTDIASLSPLLVQLGITCVQIALSRLWMSWGVKPDMVMGHSLGEYAALNVAGVLSTSDTIYLVGARAQSLLDRCNINSHAMLAVKATTASMDDLPALLRTKIEIACINGSQDIVLSGASAEIDAAADHFKAQGTKCTRLNVPFAFHSSQVDPILASFEAIASSVIFNKAQIPIVSPLLGDVLPQGATIDPTYLRRHARDPVDFFGAISSAQKTNLVSTATIWLEIGPHPVCLGMVKSALGTKITCATSLRKGEDGWKVTAGSMSLLHNRGLKLDWNEFHRDFNDSIQMLDLPKYAFDDKNYWIQYTNDWNLSKGDVVVAATPIVEERSRLSTTSVQKIVEETVKDGKVTLVIESDLARPDLHAAVTGHLVNGSGLCPSSLYGDMAMTVADYMHKLVRPPDQNTAYDVCDMEVFKPLIAKIGSKEPQIVRLTATTDSQLDHAQLLFSSGTGKAKIEHAKCTVKYGDKSAWLSTWQRSAYLVRGRVEALKTAQKDGRAHRLLRGMVYKLFAALVQYDSKYRGMEEVILDSAELEATAKVAFQTKETDGSFYCSPYWIDSLGHLSGFIVNGSDGVDSANQVYVSHGWQSLRIAKPLSADKKYQTYVKMQPAPGKMVAGDIYIFEEDVVIGVFEGLKFQCIPRNILNTFLPPVGASKALAAKAVPQVKSPVVVTESKNMVTTTKTSTSGISIIHQTLVIIAEEVGVGLDELPDAIEFADLGVDSLMSLSISGRMREEFEINVHSHIFNDYPTVGQLKSHLMQFESKVLVPQNPVKEIEVRTEVKRETVVPVSRPIGSSTLDAGLPIVDRTLEIIAEEVGVCMDELPDAIEFADLGVDSLMSLSISGRMREEFEINLHSHIFIDHPTVGQLKSFLAQFESGNEIREAQSLTDSGLSTPSLDSRMATPQYDGDSSPTTPPADEDDIKLVTERIVNTEKEDETVITEIASLKMDKIKGVTLLGNPPQKTPSKSISTPQDHLLETLHQRLPSTQLRKPSVPHRSATSVLLQGNSRKSTKTLWIFPDGGGSATSYVGIPDLSPEIAVFGLNSPFMKTPEEYNCGVDGITTMMLLELRRKQAHGPYSLAGWSAGGVVAFEAAQQLIAAGEVVEKLILIDSPCPLIIEPLPQSLHQFFNQIGLLGDGLRTENKTPAWLLPHFAASVSALSQYRGKVTKLDPSKAPKTYAIWCEDGVCKLSTDPKPEPYPYGHAQWLLENRTDFGPNQWDEFIPLDKMSMTSVPGNHFTMMREPSVTLLGNWLRDIMLD